MDRRPIPEQRVQPVGREREEKLVRRDRKVRWEKRVVRVNKDSPDRPVFEARMDRRLRRERVDLPESRVWRDRPVHKERPVMSDRQENRDQKA